MAVIGITDGSEVTVSEPSRTVTIEEAEQIATASYASFTAKDYEQLANKPSIEGVTLVGDTELSEIGAAAADHTHSLESLGAAAADHTHSLESLGAAAADHSHTLESLGAAAANHSHSLESLGAAAANHTHTPASIGAAEADHTHTPESIGAAAASHTHAASSITGLGSAALMDDDDFDAAGAAAAVLGTAQDDAGDATVYGALASAAAVEDALEHHTHTPAEIGAAPAVHTHSLASLGAAAEIHEHDASDITSGVLDGELIPDLPASKITSGTLGISRIPTIPITKGGTGATDAASALAALGAAAANHTHTAADVGAADAVHSHAATDIASGTLASDRLPTVPVSKGGTGATTAAAARTNLSITPANIGAAASSHTHDASDVGSGTLSADRLPTIAISKGGTGSTTAAAARTALGIGGSQLNGTQIGGINSNRQAVEVTNSGQNMCGLILKRGTMTMAIVLVDLWSANLAVWGELPADLHFIRPSTSGNTNKFTIQNNLSISGSAIAMVGIGCTFGTVTETEAAIAENFTRTQMDDFVPSTGGAFSGNVVHENANLFVDDGSIVSGTTPSANQYSKGVWIRDAQNAIIGSMNVAYYTNGRQALRLLAQRVIGGTTLYNGLMCWIDDNGNRGISVDDAAAWRSALEAAASSHTHSADDVASGTLAAARLPTITASKGGTGRTTLTSGSYLVGNGTGQVTLKTPASVASDLGVDHVGDWLDPVTIADVSVPSGGSTGTIIGSVTIPAGIWVLKGIGYFASNATGVRKLYFGSSTSYANQRNNSVTGAAHSGVMMMEVAPVVNLASATTYNLIAYQDSGSALNVRGYICGVRIK